MNPAALLLLLAGAVLLGYGLFGTSTGQAATDGGFASITLYPFRTTRRAYEVATGPVTIPASRNIPR